jgi:hypothetical protein
MTERRDERKAEKADEKAAKEATEAEDVEVDEAQAEAERLDPAAAARGISPDTRDVRAAPPPTEDEDEAEAKK